MADGSTDLVPAWERQFPGRFRYELDALAAVGAATSVNAAQLAEGILELEMDWPFEGGLLKLRVVFPGSYPFFRPLVFLTERPFPSRHVRPTDGLICLLGQETGQWQPNLSLAQLLTDQLPLALKGTPDEDPQGEPAEMWWNAYSGKGSYALVDTGWNRGEVTSGRLRIVFRALPRPGGVPALQAAVVRVEDAKGNAIGELSSPPPPTLIRRATMPWAFVGHELLPTDPEAVVAEALASTGLARRMQFVDLGGGWAARICAIAYPSELQQGVIGDGWLFLSWVGRAVDLHPRKGRRSSNSPPSLTVVRTLRAGERDLGFRIPAVQHLRRARIGVVGLGAIGSPIVLSLARNRAQELTLLECDEVEPGTTVRWARGASAWGLPKTEALNELLASDYPGTNVVLEPKRIGQEGVDPGNDLGGLRTFVISQDIIVDATAAYGVTVMLAHLCREAGKTLVSAYASPGLEGGVVAIFRPDGGCPTCLEWARHDGLAPRAPGSASGALTQPPGCASPTFSGTDFDLQELSLQAVRAVVAELAMKAVAGHSDVLTLTFRTEDDAMPLPRWEQSSLERHNDCSCSSR